MPVYLVFGDQDGRNTDSARTLVELLRKKDVPVLSQEIKGGGHSAPFPEQSWWSNALEFVTARQADGKKAVVR